MEIKSVLYVATVNIFMLIVWCLRNFWEKSCRETFLSCIFNYQPSFPVVQWLNIPERLPPFSANDVSGAKICYATIAYGVYLVIHVRLFKQN